MVLSNDRSRFRRWAAGICLFAHVFFVAGMMSWGVALLAAMEGSHQLAVRVVDQDWVIVLGHQATPPNSSIISHQHGLLTQCLTACTYQSQESPDHLLASHRFHVLLDDQDIPIKEIWSWVSDVPLFAHSEWDASLAVHRKRCLSSSADTLPGFLPILRTIQLLI